MTSFGAALRSERERSNTSVDQLAEATKLAPRFLLAIESDDLHKLPGGVFNKGIVRSYCRVLGLDEERWLKRFAASLPSTGTEEPSWAEFAENVRRSRPAPSMAAMRLRWMGVLLMVLGVAAACALTWRFALRSRLASIRNSEPSQARQVPRL